VLDLQGSPRSLFAVLATGARVRAGWRKGRLRDLVYTHRAPYAQDAYAARLMLRVPAAFDPAMPQDVRLDLPFAEEDRASAHHALDGAGLAAKRLVALSVVARVEKKRWPATKYAALARRIVERFDVGLVFTYGPGERAQAEDVIERADIPRGAALLFGDTTLAGVAAMYERCRLWVGNDGGPMHVATAAQCAVVMIVGSHFEPKPPLPELARQEWLMPPPPSPRPAAEVEVDAVWDAVTRALDGSSAGSASL
jgi:ADP-heptose:LPS heptosyltransferase